MGVKRPKQRRPPKNFKYGRRRTVPPDATGAETVYLQKVKEARTPLTVHLLDGSRVEGVIEYFDTEMIKVTRPAGPHVFVRKDDIRYVEEADR